MAKVREILGHVEVQTAERRRICHRNREAHVISKGDACLVIREAGSNGRKNYCRECAEDIIERARRDLGELRAALGMAMEGGHDN